MTGQLDYFEDDEFQGWAPQMAAELKVKTDLFRHLWGAPVRVSPAAGAVGRHGGGASQHNIDRWGEVLAVDLLPSGIRTREDAHRAIETARQCGFRGIGFYPHWNPSPGLHVDTRRGRKMADPALWGGVATPEGQKYVSLSEAVAEMREF